MEDSLSSSYDSLRTKARKQKKRSSAVNSSRSGPEGNSLGQASQMPVLSTSTPAPNTPNRKQKKSKSSKSINTTDDSEADSMMSPRTKKVPKRKKSQYAMQEGDGDSFESMDSKRSRFSSKASSVDDSIVKAKKKAPPTTDLSWELAVEKARGMPDGAMDSDSDSMDDDEIDVDASPQPAKATAAKKDDDKKSKPLSAIQNAARKLKQMKTKGCSQGESPKPSKRKSEEDLTAADDKKVKLEDMTKKDRKKVRKMSKDKDNYEVSAHAKHMWEELRRFDLTPEKRFELSSKLHGLVKNKAKELIYAHDTSRVIQCLLKYGAQEHKNAIFEELKEFIVEMSKSKYAKFFVRKLMKYGTKAQRNFVFRKLYGNVRKLLKHKEAAEIVEIAYNDYANALQRQALLQEFYGPSFALFKTEEDKSLDKIIQSDPEKRDSILRNMKEILTSLSEKSVLQYSIVHKIFYDFFTYATGALRSEMIESIREGVVHMLHTREGSRVAMVCLWHGTNKDRKVIVKSFKSYVSKICKEEYGHLVMLSVFDCVDDTKLVNKALLDELLKSVHDIALDQFGRKVLLYLLSPRDPAHFHPDVVNILKQGDGNEHSKKDAVVRNGEFLEHVSRPLILYIKEHCQELVTNNAMLLLLLSIITHAKCDPTEAMLAVSELAAVPFVSGSHMVEQTAGHLTMKRLILNDIQRLKNTDKVLFSDILLDILPDGSLKSWAACNRGCFILLCLLDVKDPNIQEKLHKQLKGIKKLLAKLEFKGAKLLMEKL